MTTKYILILVCISSKYMYLYTYRQCVFRRLLIDHVLAQVRYISLTKYSQVHFTNLTFVVNFLKVFTSFFCVVSSCRVSASNFGAAALLQIPRASSRSHAVPTRSEMRPMLVYMCVVGMSHNLQKLYLNCFYITNKRKFTRHQTHTFESTYIFYIKYTQKHYNIVVW